MIVVIVFLISLFIGFCFGVSHTWMLYKKKLNYYRESDSKWFEFYNIFNMWLEISRKGISIADYFREKNIDNIAIYGMKELGKHLFETLNKTDVSVRCIIDKNTVQSIDNIKVYTPYDDFPKVDAIVVTAIHYYASIEEELHSKVDCPIINLYDVLYEVLNPIKN